MATVSSSSIMMAAQEITSDFMDGKVTLNEGVSKKASELGYNAEQTKRLIERTNTEAFMKKFATGVTEFPLADPEVILGSAATKTASAQYTLKNDSATAEEGMFKAASENTGEYIAHQHFLNHGGSKEYAEKIANVQPADIFGMTDEQQKVAGLPFAIDPEIKAWNKALCNATKTASELQRDKDQKEFDFFDKLEELASHIKQASLSGSQSIRDSELELLNMFPEHTEGIRELYDNVVVKMASEGVNPITLERADYIPETKLAYASDLTNLFEDLIDIAKR